MYFYNKTCTAIKCLSESLAGLDMNNFHDTVSGKKVQIIA